MMTSLRLASLLKSWKAKRGWCESPFQMGSGADTNGCGLCRPWKSLSFGDERGGFLRPLPTPWVEPQFTESYQRFSFVFFRWIIIVIAPFHKAANQWPRVNGVKHSGFRVALPQHTHWGELCSAACVVGLNVVEVQYYAAAVHLWLPCRHLLEREREGNTWEVSLEAIFDQIPGGFSDRWTR